MRAAETYRAARRNIVRAEIGGHALRRLTPKHRVNPRTAPRVNPKFMWGRHIIRTEKLGNISCELHATKGWRCYRNRAVQ